MEALSLTTSIRGTAGADAERGAPFRGMNGVRAAMCRAQSDKIACGAALRLRNELSLPIFAGMACLTLKSESGNARQRRLGYPPKVHANGRIGRESRSGHPSKGHRNERPIA